MKYVCWAKFHTGETLAIFLSGGISRIVDELGSSWVPQPLANPNSIYNYYCIVINTTTTTTTAILRVVTISLHIRNLGISFDLPHL